MRTLVIDSATEACSVALFDDGDHVASDYRLLGRGHAEHLVPMIAALPERGRAARIAVSLGPGSFTGIRVGLAAARALAFAWDGELIGYPTPALVAAMARAIRGEAALSVVMTAGHGEWFVQQFAATGIALSAVVALGRQEAIAAVGDDVLVGSGAEALATLRGRGEALTLLPDARRFPELAPDAPLADVAPIYGRLPDARPALGRAPSGPAPPPPAGSAR